jgi:hypothetical protein
MRNHMFSLLRMAAVVIMLVWAVGWARARSCGSEYSTCMDACGTTEGECTGTCNLDYPPDECEGICAPNPNSPACQECLAPYQNCLQGCQTGFNNCSTTCYDEYCS